MSLRIANVISNWNNTVGLMLSTKQEKKKNFLRLTAALPSFIELIAATSIDEMVSGTPFSSN